MSTNPYKILVVDDEPDLQPLMLQRMRRSIRAGKYIFVFAGNGVEALERLREQEDIDMVVSDINMPQMDGLTLLDQIAQLDPNIRSVIISAYGDMKNIRTAMNRGAFDFITKPVDFDDLRITIDRTLEHMARWREALASRDQLVTLQHELDIARKMQRAILPTEFPDEPGYRICGDMEPARNVGGDFFDVIPLEHGRVGLAIADVSDKGVPAALFMMSSRTLLKGAAIGSAEPSAALREVNNMLCDKNESMMFVTLLYGIYDPASGELTYANGGHNSPVVVHSDKSCAMLPLTDGIAIGVMPDLEYQQKTITLSPGDTLTFYTDGVTEAMNENNEELGEERLFDILKGASSKEPEEIIRAIFEGIKTFVGDAPQSDDITCMTIYRTEN